MAKWGEYFRTAVRSLAIAVLAALSLAGIEPGSHCRGDEGTRTAARTAAASRPCKTCRQPRCCCPPPIICPPGTVGARPAPVVTPGQMRPSTPPDTAAPSPQAPGAPPEALDALNTSPSPSLNSLAQSNLGGNLPSLSAEGALGGVRGVPNMFADNFGGGSSVSILPVVESFQFNASGFIVSGSPGAVDSTLVYETTGGPANDFFSQGLAIHTNNNGFADAFRVSEPVPPTDAPLPTGPGAIYLGGQATTTASPYMDGDVWSVNYAYGVLREVIIPASPGGGVLVGRQKIAENNSPIPRDRLLFNYSLFTNVPLLGTGPSVNRFTFGFEKTFLSGDASVELRAPMAATVSSDLMLDGATGLGHGEMGDLMLTTKFLLWESDSLAIAAGMGLTIPTADDTRVFLLPDWEFARVSNRSVHLMPYMGWIASPSDDWFWQGFLQLDIDSNGNPVQTNLNNRQLVRSGVVQDATYLYGDLGVGYWFYRSRCRTDIVRGIAPTVELHYNRSLSKTDAVQVGQIRIGQVKDDIQILNMVIGSTVRLGRASVLQLGYATPIGNNIDHQFDGEFRLLMNRYF